MTDKEHWIAQFTLVAGTVHKRNIPKFAKRMYDRCTQWRYGLLTRSRKHGVPCEVTVADLRELLRQAYGTPCKYCGRRLDMNTLVLDHIIPISKGGSSNIDNLQIICKTSNGIKGALSEKELLLLLQWLDTLSPEMKKDISVRLARGVI